MRPLTLSCATLALALASCSRLPSECRAVVSTISDDDKRIQELSARASDDAAKTAPLLRESAGIEEALAGKLEALRVTTSPLDARVRDYARFARGLAAEARDFAGLLDGAAAMKGREAAIAERGRAAFERVGKRCAAPPPALVATCHELDVARGGLADVERDDHAEEARLVDAVAANLRRVRVDDGDLAADVALAARVLDDWSALLRELSELMPKVAKNQASLDAAFARDAPLTNAINEICAR